MHIIDKLVLKKNSNNEVPDDMKLINILSEKEYKLLTSVLDSADIMLLPVEFYLDVSLGHLFGGYTFRLYDLSTSEIIYEATQNLNVNDTSPYQQRYMIALLTAMAHSDYNENYYGKLRNLK